MIQKKVTYQRWTNRILKSDRTVKQFLLEHGIEQVTDWMILNYMTPGHLTRILSDYQRTQTEIDQALQLLNSYHQVYRTHLLQIRRTGAKTRYPEPTLEQLSQISYLSRDINSPEQVRQKLQNLASLLRAERIRVKNGSSCVEPLADNSKIITVPQKSDHPSEFLAEYRQQLDQCLIKSAVLVIQTRFDYLQGKKSARSLKKAKKYIKALHLFHCRGVSMTEIAIALALTDQPEVSRLLELKNLRSDIGRNTLSCLLKCVLEIAEEYVTPHKLRDLESKIQAILDEEIQIVIEQARINASSGPQQVIKSQLAQAICQYLCTRAEIRERT